MAQKPYATDWVDIGNGVEYSESKQLWWFIKTKTVYDEISANHNGIIGFGAQLKKAILENL